MSDISQSTPQGLGTGENENEPAGGSSETEQQTSVETQTQETQTETQPFDHPFLATVDEADREAVAKYIKSWDAGVQRKFQEIHGQYRPYKDLGEVEDIQQALQYRTLLEQSPETVYQALHQRFGNQQQQPGGFQQQQPGNQGQFDYSQLPEELQPLGPAFQQFDTRFGQQDQTIKQLSSMVETIGRALLGQQNSQKELERQATEKQEVEQYFKLAHDELGDFDDDYVMTLMAGGKTLEEAYASWKSKIQGAVNSARLPGPSVPAVLGGGGGAPSTGQPDVTKLTTKQTRDLVADVLRRAHEQ